MALGTNERQRSAVPLQDPDGRLIVVGPNGVPLAGGGGSGGGDPLSDGDDAGSLPTKALWIAGADGTVLRGLRVDASGRARVVVENSPAVSVSNFPGSQAVTGPLTDTQLRANALAVDTSDKPTREAGRVRIWDGVDEATVIQRGVAPGASDKGLAVVPLNQPRPSYQVVTPEITSGTAVAIARPLQLWHPATLLKDVFIIEIGANVGVQHTAGRFAFEIEYITAESATGTLITTNVQQTNRGDPNTGLTARHSVTAETPATAGVFQRAVQGASTAATPQGTNYDGVVIYRAKDLDDYSDAIVLRNGVAEGLLVRQNILAILTGAPIYSVYARWIERA